MKKKFLTLLLLQFLIFNISNSEWTHSNKNFNSTRLSEINEISKYNINKLEQVWIYNSGSIKKKNTVQSTPIFTGNYLIISTLHGEIHAIKPDDGTLVWRTKLQAPVGRRGFVYSDGLIFVPTRKGVVAIKEKDGSIDTDIGSQGYFGQDISLVPPIIFKNKIFIATLNNGINSYNINDGSLNWIREISPKKIAPSDGKIRIWSGFSFDEVTNTLFAVTSNMGGIVGNDRSKIENDYSSSLIAINADDGHIEWSFQDVKNDLWDFDIAGPPLITDISTAEGEKRVVIALSKTGNVIIYDIISKKLLHKNAYKLIEVPKSDLPNVMTSDFQKRFTKPEPISKVYFNPKVDLNLINNKSEDYFEFKLRNTKYGIFRPPSLNNDIVTFGLHGGPSWPGPSLSADRENIITTINEYPWFVRLFYRDKIFSKLSIYSNKIESLFDKTKNIKNKEARWANNEIRSKYADKIYSILPIIGNNKIYQSKCASCHGVAGQGLMQNESYGDKYYPTLAGITLTEKAKNIKNLKNFLYAHKYEKNFMEITNSEFEELKAFFYKRDKVLNSFNLLAINGRWQLFLDENKNPASPPPWGKIVSINIENGEKAWEIPFGEEKINNKIVKGLQNFGGILNIASGIFFATGTTDENIYAYETSTGNKIWQDKLPAAGSAPPMTFKYNNCQYIIVNATGGRFYSFKKNADATVAYKLNNCKS